jgi:hypothetical protein
MEQMHAVYRADDMEIWEVRSSLDAPHGAPGDSTPVDKDTVHMRSWGSSLDRVSVRMTYQREQCEAVLEQKTDAPHQAIGCYLWPSSVIMSRFLLENADIPAGSRYV